MKKGILLLLASGAFLVSCGPSPEEAADEICKCYEDAAELVEKSGDAETTDELLSITEEIRMEVLKGDECKKGWDEKYNGQVDVQEFKKAVKEKNQKVFEMLDARGLF